MSKVHKKDLRKNRKNAKKSKPVKILKRPSKSTHRDKLGRFCVRGKNVSKKPKIKKAANSNRKREKLQNKPSSKKRVLRRIQKRTGRSLKKVSRRNGNTFRNKKHSLKRNQKTVRSLPFIDGQRITGRDPAFKRVLSIEDDLKEIVAKPMYSRNEAFGIAGKKIEIQKRKIILARPTRHKALGDWKYDEALNAKVKEFYDAEGSGLYYLKFRFVRPVQGELVPKWVSTPRTRISSLDDLRAEFFNFKTMLEMTRETNIYGFQDAGYGFCELEIERISE